MRINNVILTLLAAMTVVAGCAALDTGSSIPKKHEEEVKSAPDCLECHEADETVGNKYFSSYRHNETFFKRHGDIVGDFQAICESCHKRKFCSDCHGANEEISPGRKLGNRPDRGSPHRGDYFSKHKIEGRIDQAKCFRCHGRRNNKTCKQCH